MRRGIHLFISTILCVLPLAAAAGNAPLTDPASIAWAHAPFEMGECSICHESSDPAAPGPLVAPVNDLCFSCHEMFQEMLTGFSNVHPPVEDSCVDCHSPHNSTREKLLNLDTADLCGSCHDDILDTAIHSPVKHDSVTQGRACLNCHDPHASNVEMMLTSLPYDLCVDCHGQDGMTDDAGKPMTNIKSLIQGSFMQHGPVENGDCSACHKTHGGQNFRMLINEYPEKFYAPYATENYELCFTCHEIDAFLTEETTSLTGFRDGERNLHFVHVNKEKRGRTCRACHEVHASPQEHMIRDSVPYGSSGWQLKINFTKTESGGSCAKTCHPTKSYDNRPGLQ